MIKRLIQRPKIYYTVIMIAAAFAAVGLIALLHTRASTPYETLEPENGSINVPAVKGTDSTASNGSFITFGSQSTSTNAIVSTNFDSLPTGPLSLANFRTAMGSPSLAAADLNYTSIVSSAGHGNVIRQTLPANQYGVGVTTDPPLQVSVDEIAIQYDIKFNDNFEWGWGGKLPGLGGAKPGVKSSSATGCKPGTIDAWSGRGMWITKGSYGSVTGSNEWIGYMYNHAKTDACGDNIRTNKQFTAGQWHTVKQYYKMNTIAQSGTPNNDGIHRMWLDGVQIINATNAMYRKDTDLHANYIFWEIFRGGGDSKWSTPNEGYIDIDNLLITTL